MLFQSLDFVLFFLLIFIFYWKMPLRLQNIFLLICSYLFYAYWDWRFLGLILASTVIDYFAAQYVVPTKSKKVRYVWLAISLTVNLGLLFTFKYYDFFISSFAQVFGVEQSAYNKVLLNVVLPIGISFYTFQTLSYTLDCFKGQFSPRKNYINVSLFVSFFPQLIAGPIERAKKLIHQIECSRKYDSSQILNGLLLYLWGAMKKVYIGDSLTHPIESFFSQDQSNIYYSLFIGLLVTFKVYFDFSGYSDMAKGLAKMLGFELSLNFKPFYYAKTASEFWRRWHITLTNWVRSYIFIPLSRSSLRVVKSLALILSFALIGLWHGPYLNYLFFGLFCAFLIMIRPVRKKYLPLLENITPFFMPLFYAVLGLLYIATLEERRSLIFRGVYNFQFVHSQFLSLIAYLVPLFAVVFYVEHFMEKKKNYEVFSQWKWPWKLVLAAFCVCSLLIMTTNPQEEFIYFKF